MVDLIVKNNQATHAMCTHQLLMAIFWEESLFNNNKQLGGTAIGFGQLEPAELKRMNAAGEIQVDVSRILADPAASVDAVSQFVDALLKKFSRQGALRAYAGYRFKDDPVWHANRDLLIAGWTSCELALKAVSTDFKGILNDPDQTIAALRKSRAFQPNMPANQTTFRGILFP